MTTKTSTPKKKPYQQTNDTRQQLLAGIPVDEQRQHLAGFSTALLKGGSGPPIILLHGPGESSFWWMQAIPELVKTHQAIAPDMPGHGASVVTDMHLLNTEHMLEWLNELIDTNCASPPVLVGHVLGGALAARFAVKYSDRISKLILVDSMGLSSFRPKPLFAFRLIRFLMQPNEKNYLRFLPQCMLDVDDLAEQMGTYWQPFLAYYIDNARNPKLKAALRILMQKLGVPAIPEVDLLKITAPTTLIWGRYDRAIQLEVAEAASARYGWPLHVIDNVRDDPKLEQPEAFLHALYPTIGTPSTPLLKNS